MCIFICAIHRHSDRHTYGPGCHFSGSVIVNVNSGNCQIDSKIRNLFSLSQFLDFKFIKSNMSNVDESKATCKDPNVFRAFMSSLYATIDAPVTAFRGKNP